MPKITTQLTPQIAYVPPSNPKIYIKIPNPYKIHRWHYTKETGILSGSYKKKTSPSSKLPTWIFPETKREKEILKLTENFVYKKIIKRVNLSDIINQNHYSGKTINHELISKYFIKQKKIMSLRENTLLTKSLKLTEISKFIKNISFIISQSNLEETEKLDLFLIYNESFDKMLSLLSDIKIISKIQGT